jgi:hypothetical protein
MSFGFSAGDFIAAAQLCFETSNLLCSVGGSINEVDLTIRSLDELRKTLVELPQQNLHSLDDDSRDELGEIVRVSIETNNATIRLLRSDQPPQFRSLISSRISNHRLGSQEISKLVEVLRCIVRFSKFYSI